jgi:hypothetical protein
LAAIVFDPKNDDRQILFGNYWHAVKDQKTWTETVKTNTTSNGDFKLGGYPTTGVRQIRDPNSQRFGFIIHQKRADRIYARLVDESTMKLSWQTYGLGSPAK